MLLEPRLDGSDAARLVCESRRDRRDKAETEPEAKPEADSAPPKEAAELEADKQAD